MMNTMITIENGEVLPALRSFLKKLFESGIVDALYVPLDSRGGGVMPALVVDPTYLDQANPLAPVMPINSARAISAITGKHPPAKIGAVLRPCEIRALIELVKLQQASLEGVTLISLDCPGTFEVNDYSKWVKENTFDLSQYLAAAKEGQDPNFEGLTLRPACQMCTQPVATSASVKISLFGVDTQTALSIEVEDDLASQMQLSSSEISNVETRKAAVEKYLNAHQKVREKELSSIRAQMNSNGGMAGLFSSCIRCHNCMTVCPICYCKNCLFRTTAFDHPPEHYLTAARRKGATRMLGDTLLFHLTRMNHMSASCVSCGMCTSACPSDIPVGAIFSAVGEQVQAAFDYVPGRNLEEQLPLITFKVDEWTEIGEAK